MGGRHGNATLAFKCTTEYNYPYEQREEVCSRQRKAMKTARIRSYEDIPANEEALLKAIAMQPASVATDSSEPGFKYYRGGVYNGPCGTAVDHAVTVVGYGTSSYGLKYWLIKNSWGLKCGEGGFVRMWREVGGTGLCGIASQSSFPIAKADPWLSWIKFSASPIRTYSFFFLSLTW